MKLNACEKMMNVFLSLDKHQWLPFALILHLFSCRKCRTEVRFLTLAEKKAAQPLIVDVPFSNEAFMHIMRKINPDFAVKKSKLGPVTLKRWIWSGVSMILALISFRWLTESMLQNISLMLPFYLIFGCIVTVYCALFIGSNMDFFIKKISTRFSATGAL